MTQQEATELFNDFERFAARYGGIPDRDTFDVVVELASHKDPSAIRALTRIYEFCVSELLKEGTEQ